MVELEEEELGHRALAGWGIWNPQWVSSPLQLQGSSETQTPILESSKPLQLSLEGRTTYIILFSLPVEGRIVPSHLLAGLIAWAAGPLLWEPDWVWE